MPSGWKWSRSTPPACSNAEGEAKGVFSIPLNWPDSRNLGFPKLGLFGCGLANLLAFTGGLTVMLVYLLAAPSMAQYRDGARLSLAGSAEQFSEGLPMAVQYLAEGGAVAVAGVLIGLIGATALAANQIVFSIGVLVYMAPLGMAAAVSIRISQAWGEGEAHRIRVIGLAGVGVVTLWMLAFTALMVLWGADLRAYSSTTPR